ncbi:MAG: 4-hydroxy-3-methylbut-2-enyl diphosphate reductase [SAR202 cluster bacterium]|nr:4-hydroxy-3-methylbut-2-enyl diphosphate reductase [Chloroflexota bacterium]MQG51814.1 4-hydroxy-3-methylbut-2-enyl diphosphate reductase [SAR202 cluster bacterium]|tara:strand:+ start:1424 stop:2329 length:906 start_codon:yes stop_codon:yes gene_type:complete
MDILLAEPRGYCAGVVRAVDIVELALTKIGNPIYVRHEIIHNQHVVNELKDKGAIFVEEISEIPENSTVIFSAHGVSPLVWEEAQKKNLYIIDATCPLVTKVHLEAIKYAKDGYTILLVGHKGHDEVIGTMGEAPDNTILVESVEDIPLLNIPNSEKVVALTQTTLSVSDTANIISALKEKFPKLVTRNDICYATTNRQNALDSITDDVDLVLVVGAKNSSNSNRLKELASERGIEAYLVDGPEDVKLDWLEGKSSIGITSGASTPEVLVNGVIEKIKPSNIQNIVYAEENVNFKLPKEVV